MRHSDGSALGDLLLEDGNNRAIRPQHVSETHGREHRRRRLRVMLHDHLAHALGRAHNGCGVDRLVGRDEYEAVDVELVRQADRVERAEHVVLYRFARTHLHERHVLVCGSMEHRMRTVAPEHVAQPVDVAHASDFDDEVYVVVFAHELVAQQVGVVFVHVENDDAPRCHRAHLPTQLRSYRAPTACHEDGLA